ncbi:MAG: ROK family protein [Candidatus Pacebacteria bacterium]|nr:ROK family protein [Candidatus Paceibacterota bacterium]
MYILFDIGGTKMRIAGSRDLSAFVGDPLIIETPEDFEEGIRVLIDKISILATGESIEGIAGGIAGPVDQGRGMLLGGPNLKGWVGKPLATRLAEHFGVSVKIANDTALVGLGEIHFGAGGMEGISAYLTVSTGVGGCRFVDGEIDMASVGFEPGHQIIDAGKGLCSQCESGTLESYIGGAATQRRMKKRPYDIDDLGFWDEYAKWLAYGLNNVAVFWSPKTIVLGGSMIVGDPAIPLDHTKECLKGILKIFPEIPEIKKAELSDLGGLYGGMILIKQSGS